MNYYKHWQYHLDEDNILWLGFDREIKTVNSLSQEAMGELNKIIEGVSSNSLKGLERNNSIRAIIIYSKKKTGFIAGADVTEFKHVKDASEARGMLENGHSVMNAIEKLRIPTIAMIDGFCLGGGFELSLACNYRIATDSPSTKIGLPEIMLGIMPGWGGTVRLARLIGGSKALPLIMQGRAVDGRQAFKLGMIDAVVPKRQLEKTARYFAQNKPSQHKPKWLDQLFNYQGFRQLFAYFAEQQLSAKVKKQHYPAPFAVLENWKKYGVEGTKPFRAEIDADLEVINHPTARNLIRVYFLQEDLKELAKTNDFKAKHVHVIGAGTMGGDIAAWCAYKGLKVTLQDKNPEALSGALKRTYSLFKKKLKKDDLANLAMDRIIPDVAGFGVKTADVIIEAVFEDLKVKQDIFKHLEQNARPDAILATNTSSIPLDEINSALENKSRLVGIHFFNPVPQMMLVEVVNGASTDKILADKASSFVAQIGKLALPVASSPGFLVNRVLSAYMHETFILLSEGMQPEEIDGAMKKFGMFMGPVEMADVVGLDICLSVAKNISEHYQEPVPGILQRMVDKKHLGKKTGKGFYEYKKGKKVKNKIKLDANRADEIINRLTMRILNISVTCLGEKVVSKSEFVDAGLIFGAGFAPFRGGPMHYLDSLGKEKILANLLSLERQYGARFKPDPYFDQDFHNHLHEVSKNEKQVNGGAENF